MPGKDKEPAETLALSTKLEEEFISPLTAVRGALEILRDFPDLEPAKRRRFTERALSECARLERGIAGLATTVYAAGRRARDDGGSATAEAGGHADRLLIDEADGIIEFDFSDLEFSTSAMVDEFFDLVDRTVMASGRQWYFLVNFRECHVWPEAWITFAHRGKKVSVNYALGTVRYDEGGGDASAGPNTEPSRDAALARIDAMRLGGG